MERITSSPIGPVREECRGQSADIFLRLDQYVEEQEDAFDFARLLNVAASASLPRVNSHVDAYRAIIRQGQWPNEARPSTFAEFLVDFEASCVAYIDVAFSALRHLATGEPSLAATYSLVTASEALRGQFGKQSPTGLDARLADLDDSLMLKLTAAFGEAAEPIAWTLCTPCEGSVPTAEAALLEDFLELRRDFPRPPSAMEISLADSRRQRVARRFLRRQCRWSLPRLAQYYAEFDDRMVDRVEAARHRRRQLVRRKELDIRELRGRCSDETSAQILQQADAIAVLNGINLSVEPAFSFKGCAGLVHGMVFDTHDGLPTERLSRETIVRQKWALLERARNQLKEQIHG